MAKGNLFMGMARGKVGSVVFSRLQGKQVSRAYNSEVNNPKTRPQAIQRAVFATVSKTAAVLSKVVESSFDGFKNGADSRREFVRVNNALLLNNFNNGAAYLLPKKSMLIAPNALKISSGKLGFIPAPVPTNIGSSASALKVFPENLAVRETNLVTLADLQAMYPMIKAGSQLTFVVCTGDDTGDPYRWSYARIVLGPWLNADDTVIDMENDFIPSSAIVTSKTEGLAVDSNDNVLIVHDNSIITFASVGGESQDRFLIFGNPDADRVALCGGLIVSNYDEDKGEWVHTETTMGIVDDISWVGNEQEAIPSYMGALAPSSSDWYTEQGVGTEGSITTYSTIGQAMQAVVNSTGLAPKSISFDKNNTFGPVPEGNFVWFEMYPNTGCSIVTGSVKVLDGENGIEGLTIQRNSVGQLRIMFPMPSGKVASHQINVTFKADYGQGVHTYGFRDTISVVQS